MNNPFIYFAMSAFRALNCLVPKRVNQICLHSAPDYDDMIRGLLEEFSRSAPEYQIVILTHEVNKIPEWASDRAGQVRHYRKLSLSGVWAYLRSKHVFFTHGCFSSVRPIQKQISVNVWHGMPIKKIERYLSVNLNKVYSTFVISTSPFYTKIISYAFSVPKERVLEVGLPRNDILLKKPNELLRQQLCPSDKLVMWLPTYRQSCFGEIRLDGEPEKNIFNLPELDIAELDRAFKEMGVTVMVKPHLMAAKHRGGFNPEKLSNIVLADQAWLDQNEVTLYELLSLSDMLITDVSSVLVDYLLLNRPIVCHFPDVDTYKNSRGVIWDFDPTTYGIPLVVSQKELVDAVRMGLNITEKEILYPVLQGLMHSGQNENSNRLIAALGIAGLSQAGINSSCVTV